MRGMGRVRRRSERRARSCELQAMHELFVALKAAVVATYCVSIIKKVYLRSSRAMEK